MTVTDGELMVRALGRIATGRLPCVTCGRPHVPYRPTPTTAEQWDRDGHPYRRVTPEAFATATLVVLNLDTQELHDDTDD